MNIGVIGGDGIGPEVIDEALDVLALLRPDISVRHYDLGAARYHRTGDLLPDAVLEELRVHDAILLGAIGDPSVPSGVLERGLLLKMRFAMDHHVNLRPFQIRPGVLSPLRNAPTSCDFIVVREGTEGPYVGVGGSVRTGTEHEVATEVSVNTRYGVDRVVRYAFEAASTRRRQLTFVHKTNVLTWSGALWANAVTALGAEFPDVEVTYMHVDAATIHLVNDPARFDVIVTDNLFGDILTDLAGAITGGIGLAASGNLRHHRPQPVDVRTRTRQRARHCRPRCRRSDCGDLIGGADARASRRPRQRSPCPSRRCCGHRGEHVRRAGAHEECRSRNR